MHGPSLLARFLETPGAPDKNGISWQYNSRSDRHSKVGCWGVALDLLANSSLLRAHASDGKVILGVNHKMRDFETSREKRLDLVIARPESNQRSHGSLRSLVTDYGIPLNVDEQHLLNSLPDITVAPVGAVLVALEAKAAMTAHVKAKPRLYDELNSSHLCVHGSSAQALAIAYVQINSADRFVSSVTNAGLTLGRQSTYSQHNQPHATQEILGKIAELPRRTGTQGTGFDGIGVTVLNFANDGGFVQLVEGPPAPPHGSQFDYSSMIIRMAHEYDSRFHGV